jgi:hypothetical protein
MYGWRCGTLAIAMVCALDLGCSEARRAPSGGLHTPCASGSTRCSGDALQRCGEQQSWQTTLTCTSTPGWHCTSTPEPGCRFMSRCATGETDGKCNLASACTAHSDCASAHCGPAQLCSLSTCDNGRQDSGEQGVDCGGSCLACSGGGCTRPEDCASRECTGGHCGQASCSDARKNGTETGLDCGGGECSACALGQSCLRPEDCQSFRCDNGRCAMPAAGCADGQKNGSETDVDCGGSCAPCAVDRTCRQDPDCLSGICDLGQCLRPSCSDRRQNQDETDVDCGGRCPPCQSGQHCGRDPDCGALVCDVGLCCSPNACGRCGPVPAEICNGADDDCNGRIDDTGEGGFPCPNQVGACRGASAHCEGGVARCIGVGVAESEIACDGVDNDCNGQVDEVGCADDGNPCTDDSCSSGACHAPLPEGAGCSAANEAMRCHQGFSSIGCEIVRGYCDLTTNPPLLMEGDFGSGAVSMTPAASCSCSGSRFHYRYANITAQYVTDCSAGCESLPSGQLICW